jgi:hypothetical protein
LLQLQTFWILVFVVETGIVRNRLLVRMYDRTCAMLRLLSLGRFIIHRPTWIDTTLSV